MTLRYGPERSKEIETNESCEALNNKPILPLSPGKIQTRLAFERVLKQLLVLLGVLV